MFRAASVGNGRCDRFPAGPVLRSTSAVNYTVFVQAATFGLALLTSLLFFFRHSLSTGLTVLYGESFDALIEVAILNHWYNFFVHGATWNLTDYFYPHAGTLGFNDTNFVPGLFFTAARLAGLDPFLATFTSHVAMKAIGFGGMYLLTRRGLDISYSVAVFAAVLFTVAGSTLLQLTHGQLLSLGLTPWLTYLLIATKRALHDGRTRSVIRHGLGFVVLFGLSALNAFYFLWFFCLFALLAIPLVFDLTPPVERKSFLLRARAHAGPAMGILLVGAVALLPSLITYLPRLAEGNRHSWGGVLELLPSPATIFNVGPGNLLWGQLNQWLYPGQLFSTEDQVGFPPTTLVALAAAAWWANRERASRNARIAVALASALAILNPAQPSTRLPFLMADHLRVRARSGKHPGGHPLLPVRAGARHHDPDDLA